ncbi:MAG: hypothetical protein K0S40_4507, partial [Actinomycetospora sp.]|nr:hypothetical protein [Actinomycetospora sp.]
ARHPLRAAVVHRRARIPQVGGRRARGARGRVRRGHRLRRVGDRGLRPGLRVRHGRQARPLDVPGAALGDRGRRALLGADVLRHHDARRLAVVGRPAPRAAPRALAGRRGRLHLLRASRGRVLPAARPARRRHAAGARRHRRLLRPGQPRRRAALPAPLHRVARGDGHLGGVQPPRGRSRPAGDRPALRRRPDDGGQHHDVPLHRQGGRDHPRRSPTSSRRPARRSSPASCATRARSPR